jgi:hypothetical protein
MYCSAKQSVGKYNPTNQTTHTGKFLRIQSSKFSVKISLNQRGTKACHNYQVNLGSNICGLQERWTAIWGEEDIPCISLSMLTASVMHKLRWAKNYTCCLYWWFLCVSNPYFCWHVPVKQTSTSVGSYLHCGSRSWSPLWIAHAAWAEWIWSGRASWGSGVLAGYLARCSHSSAGSPGSVYYPKRET